MKQARLQKRLAVAAMLAVAGCAAFLLQQEAHPEQHPAAAGTPAAQVVPALLPVAAQASPALARRVYPYSIVPGGVSSRTELARAVVADKTVAAHYAGFEVDKAELRTVPKARAVYVSYRKGGQVYWTAKKVMLAEGEAVLSDGQSDIRARCGNRISDTPQLPVEVKGPSEQELDTPVEQTQVAEDGALREVAFDPDDDEGEGQPFVPQSFPNGAGLLTSTQAQASASRAPVGQAGAGGLGYLDSLADDERRKALLATLTSSASGLGGRTPNGDAANGGATSGGAASGGVTSGGAGDTAGGSDTGGGIATGGLGSHNQGDTDPVGSAGGSGNSSGSSGSGSTGSTGDSSDSGKPTEPTLRPDPLPDPLPSRDNPPKEHELPEPGSLWLTGVAAAALLIQRRLRRRPH